MLKIIFPPILASTLLLGVALPASAQDSQTAIERVRNTYNVDRLEKAKTIRLQHDYNRLYDSHDFEPDFHQYSFRRHLYVIDLPNQRGSTEFLTRISNSNYHGRSFLKDGTLFDMDYPHGLYRDNGEADFMEQYGIVFRESDTLLAILLSRSIETARYQGERMWLGQMHDLVEIDLPSSPPLRIFVCRKDGAITKMERDVSEDLTVYYTYRRHKKQDGSFIAQEASVYAEGDRIYFSYNRNIDINNRRDPKVFEIDKGILEEPTRVDQSELSVESLNQNPDSMAPLVYHVGQGESYTTFMQTGDSITGFGGKAGFADRLKAYRDETGISTPLGYVVIPSHHAEEIAGGSEAAAEGATLLTTEFGLSTLAEVVDEDTKIEVIETEKDIDGLKIFAASTDLSSQILAGFFAPQKAALQSSHYASPYVDSGFYAKYTGVTLYNSFSDEIKNSASVLISTESKKPEAWSDFAEAVENHNPVPCQRNHPICRD
ncbi:MAG: hypothetical protein ABJN22_00735 [Litorimonas sp.]